MKKNSILLIFLAVLVACKKDIKKDKKNDLVSVFGRKILVNDVPYSIKGICYHPVPKGSNLRDFSNLEIDLALMKEARINTIRVYEPIDDVVVLNKIGEAGIRVIIGFGYNQGGKNDILSGTYAEYINKYKNHKAILMWELGNEYNYHPEWFDGDLKNWYKAMNAATDSIHKIDTNHPVTTAHGEVPDSLALAMNPNLDVWGMNVYRWDVLGKIFEQFKAISKKPMYFSEAGGDSYMTIENEGYAQGVNEKAQADANKNILKEVFENPETCSGVTLFSFTDGWWKAGDNNTQDIGGWAPKSSGVPYDGSPNEEFWGIVDIDRKKKKTFEIVKEKYNSVE